MEKKVEKNYLGQVEYGKLMKMVQNFVIEFDPYDIQKCVGVEFIGKVSMTEDFINVLGVRESGGHCITFGKFGVIAGSSPVLEEHRTRSFDIDIATKWIQCVAKALDRDVALDYLRDASEFLLNIEEKKTKEKVNSIDWSYKKAEERLSEEYNKKLTELVDRRNEDVDSVSKKSTEINSRIIDIIQQTANEIQIGSMADAVFSKAEEAGRTDQLLDYLESKYGLTKKDSEDVAEKE